MSRRLKFFLAGTLFIILGGMAIFCITVYVIRFHPAERQIQTGGASSATPPRHTTLWDRVKRAWRWRDIEQARRPAQQGGGRNSDYSVQEGSGLSGGYGMARDQLIVRETALAETYLNNAHGRAFQDSLYTLSHLNVPKSDATAFEIDRYIADRAFEEYFTTPKDERDTSKLPEIYTLTRDVARSRYANFEDYHYFAIVALWSGKPDEALEWANKAEEIWPSKGRAYGYVYLIILLSHAARNDTAEVMALLPQFPEHYPDWLYVETYVPDVDELIGIYPDAPLYPLIRGQMMARVYDIKSAQHDWQTALDSPRLDRAAADAIRQWQHQVREVTQP